MSKLLPRSGLFIAQMHMGSVAVTWEAVRKAADDRAEWVLMWVSECLKHDGRSMVTARALEQLPQLAREYHWRVHHETIQITARKHPRIPSPPFPEVFYPSKLSSNKHRFEIDRWLQSAPAWVQCLPMTKDDRPYRVLADPVLRNWIEAAPILARIWISGEWARLGWDVKNAAKFPIERGSHNLDIYRIGADNQRERVPIREAYAQILEVFFPPVVTDAEIAEAEAVLADTLRVLGG